MTMGKGDKTDPSEDGLDPTEEVGPKEREAHPDRCQSKHSDEKVLADACDFEPDEEVFESFPVEEVRAYIAEDGLPEVDEPDPEDAAAVPFTYDTQLCVEDDRIWVELWSDELGDEVLSRLGSYNADVYAEELERRYCNDGSSHRRRSYQADQVVVRFGIPFVMDDGKRVFVRPKRERCRHYRRQVLSFKGTPGKQKVYRLCMARRSNGGAFMTVGDEGIWGCDLRDPRDPETERIQDEKDRAKLINRPDLIRVPILGFGGDEIHLEESGEQSGS
jgi:hypothetical protein